MITPVLRPDKENVTLIVAKPCDTASTSEWMVSANYDGCDSESALARASPLGDSKKANTPTLERKKWGRSQLFRPVPSPASYRFVDHSEIVVDDCRRQSAESSETMTRSSYFNYTSKYKICQYQNRYFSFFLRIFNNVTGQIFFPLAPPYSRVMPPFKNPLKTQRFPLIAPVVISAGPYCA